MGLGSEMKEEGEGIKDRMPNTWGQVPGIALERTAGRRKRAMRAVFMVRLYLVLAAGVKAFDKSWVECS